MEHQYRVEPEEDAKSEGTLDSQEAAQGRLAVLDIDLEDKNKCMLSTIQTPKLRRAYWIANLEGISRRGFAKTDCPGGAKKISILSAPLSLKMLDSNWTAK